MYIVITKNKKTGRIYRKLFHKISKKDNDCMLIKIKKQNKKTYILNTSLPTIFQEIESVIQDIEKKIDKIRTNEELL